METNFSEWLLNELKSRSMSQAELARRSAITPAQISRIISGQRGAGEEALRLIADALKLPPEIVFRAAGLLPDAPPPTEQQEQLIYLYSQLSEDQKNMLIEYANFLLLQTK